MDIQQMRSLNLSIYFFTWPYGSYILFKFFEIQSYIFFIYGAINLEYLDFHHQAKKISFTYSYFLIEFYSPKQKIRFYRRGSPAVILITTWRFALILAVIRFWTWVVKQISLLDDYENTLHT